MNLLTLRHFAHDLDTGPIEWYWPTWKGWDD